MDQPKYTFFTPIKFTGSGYDPARLIEDEEALRWAEFGDDHWGGQYIGDGPLDHIGDVA